MSSRRDFLKGSLILGVAVAAGARAGAGRFGISIGTRLHEGHPRRWRGRRRARAQGRRRGGKVTILTRTDDPAALHRQAHAPHARGKGHRRKTLPPRPEGGMAYDLPAAQGHALGHELPATCTISG